MNAPGLPQGAGERRALLWRIHLWAAIVCTPLALAAAATGLMYVFTPQAEAWLHGSLDRVKPGDSRVPLDQVVEAARSAAPPDHALHSVVLFPDPAASVRVAFMPVERRAARAGGHDHASGGPVAREARFLRPSFGIPQRAQVVYVDPYDGRVLGQLAQSQRFREWSRKLHSTYLVDGMRWAIELAASCMLVMLVTGIAIGWPAGGRGFIPKPGIAGRAAWKQWHVFVGLGASAISFVMLATGLTWSQYAGQQVKFLRDALGQQSARIPASIESSPSSGMPLTWEAAWKAIRSRAPEVITQVAPPAGPAGTWRANHVEGGGRPTARFDLLVDRYTGATLYYSGWDALPAFGKATAVGIPFHRGEFGPWNQLLLAAFALATIGSLVSGWVMLANRRARGLAWLPPLPARPWRALGWGGWAWTAVLLSLMPMGALAALAIASTEAVLRRTKTHAKA